MSLTEFLLLNNCISLMCARPRSGVCVCVDTLIKLTLISKSQKLKIIKV